jgi:gliding motility-associated-like protein
VKRRIIFLILIFIGFNFPGYSQTADPCKKSTEGTDFWFGFLEGRWDRKGGRDHYVEITVTAREATTFTIKIGHDETPFGATRNVAANDKIRILIPYELVEPRGSEKIENKGIHLVSEKPVNVYALNYDKNSADVAVIYPVNSLGKEYFAVCYTPYVSDNGDGRNSEFAIVATEDFTIVEITPTKKTDQGHKKDSVFTVTLQKGEIYQVQSENIANAAGQGDLTGSFVMADKPVAMYSGSEGTRIPAGKCCWDHLYEQIPPVRSWGREYYTVPLKSRSSDRYRIMAAEDNTIIKITGLADIVLNKGEFIEKVFNSNQAKRIFADKPILVAQYSQSHKVDNMGDPFMIILSSVTQSKNDVTFVAYDSDIIQNYYVNIVSHRDEIYNIRFDGNGINSAFKSFKEGDYSYAQIAITPGTHRIENVKKERGFLAYVYGYGGVESYGYGVGFNLDLVLDLGENIDFNGDTLLLCYGSSIELDAGPYFDTYNWSTGDTTQKITVDTAGKYSVQTTTIDGCNLEDSIYVFVSHPEVDLGIDYDDGCFPYSIKLDGNDGFDKYVWQNENNDTLSTQQVYTASKTGEYRITVYNEHNCPARDTMNLVVFPVPKIKIKGESLICGAKTNELAVQITDAPEDVWNYEGSYTWSSDKAGLKFTNETHTSVDIEATDWGKFKIYYHLVTSDGCNVLDSFLVRFHPQPTSEFRFEDDSECEGYSKKLIYTGAATDSATFKWDLDGCQFVDTLGWQKYTVTVGAFLDKQPYIKLVIDDNGCWSDTTIHPLGAKPNFTMDADNLRGCDSLTVNFTSQLLTPDNVDFIWTFNDGEVVESQNVTKHYPATGYFDVSLTIINPVTKCQNGFTLDSMIKVFPTPTAEITVDQSICFPDSADISYTHNIDSSVCSWSFEGAHQSGQGNDSITVVLDEPFGKVILTVDEYGCISKPVEVTLKRKPHFNFYTENESGCQPYSVEITAGPEDENLSFTWITDTLPYPTGTANIYLFPDSGRFDISLIATSGETGCFDTLTKPDWIWVHPKPIAAYDVDYPVALIEHADISFFNHSEMATKYLWDFGDEENSTEFEPIHKYTELGEYTSQLFVESDFGCKDTSELLIKILPFSVFTPNAFRPNSNIAENQTFMPVGTGADISRFYLKIYDRWGQIVFETKTPENSWDGTDKNGDDAPMGNYVWISHYFDIQGFEHNQKGQVMLVR